MGGPRNNNVLSQIVFRNPGTHETALAPFVHARRLCGRPGGRVRLRTGGDPSRDVVAMKIQPVIVGIPFITA